MKKLDFNPYFLRAIQPVAGVAFKEDYIRKGDGYEACIRVMDFKTIVEDFWLDNIFDFENTIATLDVQTENQTKILETINKSISEQYTRIEDAASNIDRITATAEVQKLNELVADITQSEEVIKNVTLRYYVSATSIDELNNRVANVISKLQNVGYKAALCLNEQKYEWQSLFKSATEQGYLKNKRYGNPMPSLFLGGGYPFHFTELNDPTGFYLGDTETGGNVIFDIFTKTDIRKSYNALAIGMMGSGKSTLLKILLENNAIINNTIRVLDISGEFKTLIEEFGGRVLALDGTDGIINPLQIFATIINDETNEVFEEQSYMLHLSKVSMIYSFVANPEQIELREFERVLSEFYNVYGIERDKASKYKANEYPILEEFLSYLKTQLYEDVQSGIVKTNISISRQKRLENIVLNIEGLVRDYGSLFNGHSSIQSFDTEQIVSFEVKNLANFDKRIFNAQIFNILTMLWNNALKQGSVQKNLFDNGKVNVADAQKFFLLIDEAHKFVNTNNILAVEYLINFEREARKYFAGLIFATQSIRDVVPENSSGEAIEKIKTLFELSQYKFIMQQDNNSKGMLMDIFSGQITESEINKVPYFGKGECILAINGDKNIKFQIKVSDKELNLFKGGA